MRLKLLLLGGLVGVLLPVGAIGQTIQERVQILEDKVELGVVNVGSTIGMDIHAMAMFDYNFNSNDPRGDNPLSTFNFKDNTFDVRQASLFFQRERDNEPWGFGLVLDFGSAAEAIASRWGGSDSSINSDGTASPLTSTNICGNDGSCQIEVREVFLTYDLPASFAPDGSPITIKAGKFITLLGYEVIPTWENFNHNISTSILFGFSIPFTHTGLLANVPINDYLAFDLGVVNGWDQVDDINTSKTLLGGMAITPTDNLSFYIAGTFGSEQAPKDEVVAVDDDGFPVEYGLGEGAQTGAVTLNGVFQATDVLTLVVDGSFANVDEAIASRNGPGLRSAIWYGVAGYIVAQLTDDLGVALRAEWFDDPDGFQTGLGSDNGNAGGTFWEITPTLTYNLTDSIIARAEYRHDEASTPFFPNSNGKLLSGQDLVHTELIVAF
jgi:hypothetical protein